MRDYYNGNRPKTKTHTVCLRYNNTIDTILTNAMEETGLSKSELLRKIILEWNMLRYNED
jgi:hypothetical protein